MAMDLLDLVTKGLGSDFASKVSGLLGESGQGTQSALESGLPLLLSGLARKAGSPDGAADVLNLLNNFGASDSQLSNIGGLLSGGGLGNLVSSGGSILSALFGANNTGSIFNALGSLAGVKPGSATTLLSAVAPLAFGMLRRYTAKEGLGASGLASLLLGQRDAFARQVPESLSRAAGFAPVAGFAAAPPPQEKAPPGFLRWLPWIIGALLLLWLLSRCVGTRDVTPVQTTPAPVAAPAAAVPGLATLYFDSGSAAPAADAASTLEAVAEYARANPTARLAVSGYHDPSGDAAVNEELARNRAEATRTVLVGLGVPEAQIDLQRPLVTTGGTEERASRRVEVAVR